MAMCFDSIEVGSNASRTGHGLQPCQDAKFMVARAGTTDKQSSRFRQVALFVGNKDNIDGSDDKTHGTPTEWSQHLRLFSRSKQEQVAALMARLNEPPVAPANETAVGESHLVTESVESVKRRYIRQNRDLAKSNCTQSLRIRALEVEVSKLLHINQELKEEVLGLRREVQDARNNALSEGLRNFKEAVGMKLKELSAFVDGASEDAQPPASQEESPGTRKDRFLQTVEFKERQPLAEIMRDCQMPTISEEKPFPRLTLNEEDVRAIRLSGTSSAESPDLGPPPIARFEDERAIEFHALPDLEIKHKIPGSPTEVEDLPVNTSVNVEARRRRKDGSSSTQLGRRSLLPIQPQGDGDATAPSLRTGAKRKLSDRESEKTMAVPGSVEFSFVRKAPSDEQRPKEKETGNLIQAKSAPEAKPSLPVRKILGDKNVNTSPKKLEKTTEKDGKGKLERPIRSRHDASKERSSIKKPRAASISVAAPEDKVLTATIAPPSPDVDSRTVRIAPKTPPALSMFSPLDSEASATLQGNSDTPPPGSISMNSLTGAAETSRPSRRARAAVNYAEPSLVAKMRRPSKQMLDALSGLQDPRRAMNASSEDKTVSSDQLSAETDACGEGNLTGLIGNEHATFSRRSPLSEKEYMDIALDVAKPAAADTAESNYDKPSASSIAISALMAGSRLKRAQEHVKSSQVDTVNGVHGKASDPDIYDFKDSSSPVAASDVEEGSCKLLSKSQRRHSSAPKDLLVKQARRSSRSDIDEVGLGRASRAAARLRSMMV